MCVFTCELQSWSTRKKDQGLIFCTFIFCVGFGVIYVDAIKSSALSVTIWVASHVLVVCASVCVYASLGYTLSRFAGQIANRISGRAHQKVRKRPLGFQDELGFGYKEGGSRSSGTPGFGGSLNILNRFSALVAKELYPVKHLRRLSLSLSRAAAPGAVEELL